MNNLQEQYNKLIKEYGEDRIVWIAAAGHSAYGQDSMPSEQVTACYLPTEDELYNIISVYPVSIWPNTKSFPLLSSLLQFSSIM